MAILGNTYTIQQDTLHILDNTKWYYLKLDKKFMKKKNCIMVLFYLTGAIPGNTLQYFAIPDNTWQYLTILLQYFPILNNTYQFLTITNNTLQTWYWLVSSGIARYQQSIKYHSQYDSSIVKVSSQYSSDGFLSVLYHHNTNSGDFHKTFDAYLHSSLLFGDPNSRGWWCLLTTKTFHFNFITFGMELHFG